MRVRLEDVARAAGVSPKTVSRVLNDEANVRERTRERVLAAMAAMDYRPHLSARSLASNRSFLVAMLYDNPSSNYLTEIQDGMLAACDLHHYSMMVRPLRSGAEDFLSQVSSFLTLHRPDGLVLTPPITDHPVLLRLLGDAGVRYASVSPIRREGVTGVAMDERRAAAEMVAHLVALGHRRIAHVIGHPAHGASGWRLAGYRDALAASRLPHEPALEVQGEFSFESGVAAARALFALADRPTAVFAANDDMAAGVVWAANEHALSVPRDLSVCGFDDTPIARQLWPALTTVHQPSREMGRLAALQLLDVLRGRGSGGVVEVAHTLQLRESTAAPA